MGSKAAGLMVVVAASAPVLAGGPFRVPDGVNAAWVRGEAPRNAYSAYAEWDIFTSPVGPNAPDVGSSMTSPFGFGAPDWNVFDTSGDSFVTGTGSIYSIFTRTSITIEVPGFDRGAPFGTTVWLQLRTQGTEFDPATMNIAGEPPTMIEELNRQNLGPPGPFGGGFLVDTLIVWDMSESALGSGLDHTIRFEAAEGSMSLDRVIVDIFTADSTGGPCTPADFAERFGELDINDILAFAGAFNANDPSADFFADGMFNINDVLVFAAAFNTGCP